MLLLYLSHKNSLWFRTRLLLKVGDPPMGRVGGSGPGGGGEGTPLASLDLTEGWKMFFLIPSLVNLFSTLDLSCVSPGRTPRGLKRRLFRITTIAPCILAGGRRLSMPVSVPPKPFFSQGKGDAVRAHITRPGHSCSYLFFLLT